MWRATLWLRRWPRSPVDEPAVAREGCRMCRGAPISLLMRRTRMITGVGLVCVFVLDMDEAREFYTETKTVQVHPA